MKTLRHSGNLLLLLFGIMLMLMSILVYRSATQQVSMVSKDYYEQELHYQQQLDARNNTRGLDNGFTLSHSGDSMVLQVPPDISRALTSGKALFYCPSNDKADTLVTLNSTPDGRYSFSRSLLKGRGYILKLDLNAAGKSYYKVLQLP